MIVKASGTQGCYFCYFDSFCSRVVLSYWYTNTFCRCTQRKIWTQWNSILALPQLLSLRIASLFWLLLEIPDFQGFVEQYQESFDALLNRVESPIGHPVSCFLSGLCDEIQNAVRMFKPQTIHDAYCLAKLQEATLASISRRTKPILEKPPPFSRSIASTFRSVSQPVQRFAPRDIPLPLPPLNHILFNQLAVQTQLLPNLGALAGF